MSNVVVFRHASEGDLPSPSMPAVPPEQDVTVMMNSLLRLRNRLVVITAVLETCAAEASNTRAVENRSP
jgi:hypothetical protein